MAICKIPISCLPTSAGLDGSELIPVVEGELTKQTQLNNLSGFVDLQYITDAGNCTTNDLSTSGSITSHTLSSDHMTNTGSITTESLTATEIHEIGRASCRERV